MNKKYNVCVSHKYKDKKTGEEKQKWNTIGKAFELKNGQININIDDNISISSSLVLFLDSAKKVVKNNKE